MRKSLFVASMLTVTVAVAPACATKKFVRTEVGTVNTKVDTLTGTVEETQERTRANEGRIGTNEGRIGQVDQRVTQVDSKAEAAGRSATEARTVADSAVTAAAAASNRVAAVEASARKLVYEVTLSEDQGNFRFGATDLPDEAKARLDAVVNQLKGDAKNVFIEIEGHTDNVGGNELNHRLGLERAESVKRYLYEQHQVPLHKINVISYGEDKPVAPNSNSANRAQNRRVVVRVLS